MLDLLEQFSLAIDEIEGRHAEWFEAHPDFALGEYGKPLSYFTVLYYENGRFELLLSCNVQIPDQIRNECYQTFNEMFGY